MKKVNKMFLNIAMFFLLPLNIVSCGNEKQSQDSQDNANLSTFSYIEYTDVAEVSNIDSYAGDVKKDGLNNDDPVDNGIVKCVYYDLSINGINIPVYSTRCAESVHSFAWIDVDSDENIKLNVTLNLKNKHKNVVVLPQKHNIEASLEDNKVTATINKLGSFSFAFDKKVSEALTIYVAKKEEFNAPSDYTVQQFNPGKYNLTGTDFKDEKVAYYFKKGNYEIASINLPNNSMLYFESGSYVKVFKDGDADRNAAIRSSGTSNIDISGRAIFDFSSSQGGNGKNKGVFNFNNVSNIRYSGIITINSNSWSVCFTNSDNVLVENNMILGYRTFSDGIMLSDCQDSLVRNNFVRTGDDAIEVKSTGTEGTKNVIYEYNDVWTDKARAYGCIYESNKDVDNVIFRHNTVGFALATWTEGLGCLVICMGTRRQTTWENIHFEDIEIFMAYHALINIDLTDDLDNGTDGGTARNLYFKDIYANRAYSYAFRLCVERGSTAGKVYLDNINYNGQRLESSTFLKSEVVKIIHYNSNYANSNIKVNTLSN